MANAPQAVDIQDFQFKLRCRLKVFKNGDNTQFHKPCNLVAAASKYGLVFVGTSTASFQVIQTKEIEGHSLEEGEIAEYVCRTVQVPSCPKHLSVNCDNSILAIVIERDACATVLFYSVPSFTKQVVQTINQIRLSATPGVGVLDTSWNPTIPNIFTACKDDGSLGLYELKEGSVDIKDLPPESGATCMCWSPKGKQIAVGSRDGRIIQHKPDLKAMKIVNAPPLEGTQSVVALQWISNYQFIAVYKNQNPDSNANLLVVDAPKTGDSIYTNYEDVCYSYGSTRLVQFYMILQPTWNVLMVASSNSTEVGVLGSENERWTQWSLGDAFRAELPLAASKQETLPIGMSFDVGVTTPLNWGESTLPPAPFLLLLSNDGVLCCYTTINVKPGAAAVCQPPAPLADNSGLNQFVKLLAIEATPVVQTPQVTAASSQPVINVPSFTFGQATTPKVTTVLTIPQPVATSAQSAFSFSQAFNIVPPNTVQNAAINMTKPVPVSANQIPSLISTSQPTHLIPNKPTDQLPFHVQKSPPQSNLFQPKPPDHLPHLGQNQSQEGSQGLQKTQPTKPQPVFATAAVPANVTIGPAVTTPKSSQAPQVSATVLEKTVTEASEDADQLFAKMVCEECEMLEAELKALLQKSRSLKIDFGTDNEAVELVHGTDGLQDFLRDVTETSMAQATEVHCLKQGLMQSWAWFEDARSRLAHAKDAKMAVLLRAQPLDPASQRHLAEIEHLLYYLESQLTQASNAIDEHWENFQDSCKQSLRVRIPTMEAIFQTMVRQSAVLQKQIYVLKDISSRVRTHRSKNSGSSLLVSLDNAKHLEEQLQQLHLEPQDLYQIQYERVVEKQKKLTKSKVSKLKQLLSHRNITHVAVNKPQLTSSVSKMISHFTPVSTIKATSATGGVKKMLFSETGMSLLGAGESPIISTTKEPVTKDVLFMQSTPKVTTTLPPQPEKAAVPKVSTIKHVATSVSSSNTTSSTFKTVTNPPVSTGTSTFSFKNLATASALPAPSLFNVSSTSPSGQFNFTATAAVSKPTTAGGLFSNVSQLSTSAVTSPSPFNFSFPKTSTTSGSMLNQPAVTAAATTKFNFSLAPNETAKTSPKTPVSFGTLSNVSLGQQITPTTTLFGQNVVPPNASLVPPVSSSSTLFGQPVSTPSSSSTLFSQAVSSPNTLFGQPVSSPSTFFGQPVSSPSTLFGQPISSPSTFFGQPVSTSNVTSTSLKNLLSQSTAKPEAASIFASGVTTPTTSTDTLSTSPTIKSNSRSVVSKPSSVTIATPTAITSNPPQISASPIVLSATSSSAFAPTQPASILGSKGTLLIGNTTITPVASSGTTAATTTDASTTSAFVIGGATQKLGAFHFGTANVTTSATIAAAITVPSFATSTNQSLGFGSLPKSTGVTPVVASELHQPVIEKPEAVFAVPAPSNTVTLSESVTKTSMGGGDTKVTTAAGTFFGTPPKTSDMSTQGSLFSTVGDATPGSIFGSSIPVVSTPTSHEPFVTTTTQVSSLFGGSAPITATTSAFGTPTMSTFASPLSPGASPFAATGTTSSQFGLTSSSGSPFATTSTSVFGTPTSSIFGTAASGSVFGTVAKSSTSNAFGSNSGFGSSPSAFGSSVFSSVNTTSSGSVFGQPATFGSTSIFGGSPAASTTSIFGSVPSTTTAFGSAPVFGTPTTSTVGFGTASQNVFGSVAPSQANTFSFATAAANVPSGNSAFGGFGSGFGSPTNSDPSSFSFGGLSMGGFPTTTTSTGFNSSFGQNQNPFAKPAGVEQKPAFGGGSLFSTPATTSSTIFGANTSTFGSPTQTFGTTSLFGSSPGFGQTSAFGQNAFNNSFGSSSQSGPFSGGNQSVSQTGFGGFGQAQKPTGFGGAPAFGSAAPSGFGSAASFGGSSSFGAAPTFGTPPKVFGSTATPPGTFGAAMPQQNPTFENLAGQNTLGFGALAQQTQQPQAAPSSFSGGSSFSTWR